MSLGIPVFTLYAVKCHWSIAITACFDQCKRSINLHKPHLKQAVEVIAMIRLILDSVGLYMLFCSVRQHIKSLDDVNLTFEV